MFDYLIIYTLPIGMKTLCTHGVIMVVLIAIFTGCKTTGTSKDLDDVVNPWIGDDGNYYHTPKKGEWGGKIADMYGLSTKEVSSYNGNRNWMDGKPIRVSDIDGKFPRPRSTIVAEEMRAKGEDWFDEYEKRWKVAENKNQTLLDSPEFLALHKSEINQITSEYRKNRASFQEYLVSLSGGVLSSKRSSIPDFHAVALAGDPMYKSVCEYEHVFSLYLLKSEKEDADIARFNKIKKDFTLQGKGLPSWVDAKAVYKLKKYSLHNRAPGTHAERIAELRSAKKDFELAVKGYEATSYSLGNALAEFDGSSFERVFIADSQHQKSCRTLSNVASNWEGSLPPLVVDYEEFLVANGLEELVVSSQ